MTEAILTFVFFPTLVITCYSIDCYNASQEEKKQDGDDDVVLKYTYVEVMRELIKEKTSGGKDLTPEEEQKKKEMKRYLRETMGTDKVDEINPDELKQKMEGVSLVSRVQYRKAVGLSKTRPTVAKGEVAKFENLHADNLEQSDRNPNFGFKCLHYSVSEAVGTVKILIENKTGQKGSVRVKT